MKKALKDYSDTAIVIGIAIGVLSYLGAKHYYNNLKERWGNEKERRN
jgi:hypothetical protein